MVTYVDRREHLGQTGRRTKEVITVDDVGASLISRLVDARFAQPLAFRDALSRRIPASFDPATPQVIVAADHPAAGHSPLGETWERCRRAKNCCSDA